MIPGNGYPIQGDHYYGEFETKASDTNMPGQPHRPITRLAELRAEFLKHLDRMSADQEALGEKRETILVQRSRVQTHRKKLWTQRAKAGDAEATLMRKLMKLYTDHGGGSSSELTAAYEEAQRERDILGSMEADYLRAEQILTSAEWGFLETENSFYQYALHQHYLMIDDSHEEVDQAPFSLPLKTFIFRSLDGYRMGVALLNFLYQQFNALRLPYLESLMVFGSTISSRRSTHTGSFASDLLAQLTHIEVKVKKLREDLLHYTIPVDLILFANLYDPYVDAELLPLKTESKDLMNGAEPTSIDGVPKMPRLLAWFLDILQNSLLEKERFGRILRQELHVFGIMCFDFDSWEDKMRRYWLTDTTENPLPPPKPSRFPNSELLSNHTKRSLLSVSKSLPPTERKPSLDNDCTRVWSDSAPSPSMEKKLEILIHDDSSTIRPPPLIDKSPIRGERFVDVLDLYDSPTGYDHNYHLNSIGGWFDSTEEPPPLSPSDFPQDPDPNLLEKDLSGGCLTPIPSSVFSHNWKSEPTSKRTSVEFGEAACTKWNSERPSGSADAVVMQLGAPVMKASEIEPELDNRKRVYQQEAKQREVEASQGKGKMEQQQEDTRRHEEKARQEEIRVNLSGAETRYQEEGPRQQEEKRWQQAEMALEGGAKVLQQIQEVRRQEEKAWQQAEEAKQQEAEIKEREEKAIQLIEEARRQQDLVILQKVKLKKRNEEMRQQAEELRQERELLSKKYTEIDLKFRQVKEDMEATYEEEIRDKERQLEEAQRRVRELQNTSCHNLPREVIQMNLRDKHARELYEKRCSVM